MGHPCYQCKAFHASRRQHAVLCPLAMVDYASTNKGKLTVKALAGWIHARRCQRNRASEPREAERNLLRPTGRLAKRLGMMGSGRKPKAIGATESAQRAVAMPKGSLSLSPDSLTAWLRSDIIPAANGSSGTSPVGNGAVPQVTLPQSKRILRRLDAGNQSRSVGSSAT